MERLHTSVPMVIQLWKPINVRTPEDGDSTFSKMSVQNSATRYKAPEDIYKFIYTSFYFWKRGFIFNSMMSCQ
jgi:hypothetical protein